MKNRLKTGSLNHTRIMFFVILIFVIPMGIVNAHKDSQIIILEDKLSLSSSFEDDMTENDNIEDVTIVGYITLHNRGDTTKINTSELVLDNEDGVPATAPSIELKKKVTDTICNADNPCTIDQNDVVQFTVEVTMLAEQKTLSGYLEITTQNGISVEALPIEITVKKNAKLFGGFLGIAAEDITIGSVLGWSLVASIMLILTILPRNGNEITEAKVVNELNKTVGKVTWDFRNNWLSNVTGLSAISLAIIGFTILPGTTQFLAKTDKINEYTTLHAIFGLGIVAAPLVGTMLTAIFPQRTEINSTKVWIYLLIIGIALWSIIGELSTAVIFVDELRVSNIISQIASCISQLVLVIIGIIAACYTVGKTVGTIKTSLIKLNIAQEINSVTESTIELLNKLASDNLPPQNERCIDSLPAKNSFVMSVYGEDYYNSFKAIVTKLNDNLSSESISFIKAASMSSVMLTGLTGVSKALVQQNKYDVGEPPILSVRHATITMSMLLNTAIKKSEAAESVGSIQSSLLRIRSLITSAKAQQYLTQTEDIENKIRSIETELANVSPVLTIPTVLSDAGETTINDYQPKVYLP